MSSIQSSVGLITGLPIQDIVNQLIQVSATPRIRLANRTSLLDAERLAVEQLTSLTLALKFDLNSLQAPTTFNARKVVSSAPTVLSASIASGGQPAVGQYQFTPVQTASNQQLVSNSFDELSSAIEEGSFSFQFGGFVDKGISLDELNAGAGVKAGNIKITDRSGESATIDLSYAFTVDDVIDAINSDTTINVTASVDGDSFTLTDNTGGSENLIVQEVGGGTTAASLGLAGINVADDQATGTDVFTLHAGTRLSKLNDGNGVQIRAEGTDDLTITFRDGSETLDVDLAGLTTVGEVIDLLNEDSRLVAAISADGNRIEITDQTTGSEDFSITSVGTGTAAEDLGIAATTTGATIAGDRLVAGLRDTLLSSLNGGQGIAGPGTVNITNRNGVLSNVDLSGTETLAEVIAAINDQATGVTASINAQRHGILITDTTSGTASNLIVADGDANKTATALGIVVNGAVATKNSSSLARQSISEATRIADLKNGAGIKLSDIRITDTNGVVSSVDLNSVSDPAKTVGDVIDRINSASANVLARINDKGDGIVIIDQADGTGTLKVAELGGGSTAADLNLLGEGVELDGVQQIDGSTTYSLDLSDLSTSDTTILLSSLNNGVGITPGDFIIESSEIDSVSGNPKSIAIDLDGSDSDITTVGQLIERINQYATAAGVSVEASVNTSGTGITLTDTAGGDGTLTVRNVGNDTTATELGLTVNSTTSGNTQTLKGASIFSIDDAAESGLNTLADRINDLDAGVTASTFFDGKGYRLSLSVDESGAGRELLIDTGDGTLQFEEVNAARDAVLQFGSGSGGLVVRSSDNVFENVVKGVNVTINSASEDPVSVNVTKDSAKLTTAVREVVDAYNSIRTNLDLVTEFNEEDSSTGILFGTTAALRVDTDLARAISDRYLGLGSFDSLASVGISVNEEGRLSLDAARLEEAFTEDPTALQRFFTDASSGVVAKLNTVIDSLAGEESSLLASRSKTLTDIVESNVERIAFLDERLEREREQLLQQFARLEQSIAGLQQNLSALSSIQALPAFTESGRGALRIGDTN